MAQVGPPQSVTEPSGSPGQPAGGQPHHGRWLAACLVLLVAVCAGTAYLRHTHSPTSVTTPQGEACPASAETTAEACPLPENAAATREPFPTQAEAQVDWVLRYQQPAMVLFYSQICRPCMMMGALVQMVRRDYEPAVTFIAVASDNAANAALVRRMGVGSILAFFFVAPSGESKCVVGLMTQQDLRAELATLASAAQASLPTPTGTPTP